MLGVVHVKDVLYRDPDRPLRDLVRPIPFLPETATVEEALTQCRGEHTKTAFVVDEYGAVVGLVTMEDLMEEIVGEIADEYDVERRPPVELLADGSIRLQGRLGLRTWEELFGVELPEMGVTTLGGLIMRLLARVPEAGDEVRVRGHTLHRGERAGPARGRVLMRARPGMAQGAGRGRPMLDYVLHHRGGLPGRLPQRQRDRLLLRQPAAAAAAGGDGGALGPRAAAAGQPSAAPDQHGAGGHQRRHLRCHRAARRTSCARLGLGMRADFWSSIILPPIFLICADMTPKSLFQHHADRLMYRTVWPLRVSEALFTPLSFFLRSVSRLPQFLLRHRIVPRTAAVTSDAFRFYLSEGAAHGALTTFQRTMAENILRLKSRARGVGDDAAGPGGYDT